MTDKLVAKTERYERLLDEALSSATLAGEAGESATALAEEHLEMAEAYLDDGRHFLADGDHVTALAAFSYGHGWLDAAIRSGLLEANEGEELRGV